MLFLFTSLHDFLTTERQADETLTVYLSLPALSRVYYFLHLHFFTFDINPLIL